MAIRASTASYTTTQTDVNAGSINNNGTATGKPPTGPNVTADSSVSISSNQSPAIGLVKSASIRPLVGSRVAMEEAGGALDDHEARRSLGKTVVEIG